MRAFMRPGATSADQSRPLHRRAYAQTPPRASTSADLTPIHRRWAKVGSTTTRITPALAPQRDPVTESSCGSARFCRRGSQSRYTRQQLASYDSSFGEPETGSVVAAGGGVTFCVSATVGAAAFRRRFAAAFRAAALRLRVAAAFLPAARRRRARAAFFAAVCRFVDLAIAFVSCSCADLTGFFKLGPVVFERCQVFWMNAGHLLRPKRTPKQLWALRE